MNNCAKTWVVEFLVSFLLVMSNYWLAPIFMRVTAQWNETKYKEVVPPTHHSTNEIRILGPSKISIFKNLL